MVRETDQVAAPRVGNHVARVSRKDVIADGVVRLQLTEPGVGACPTGTPVPTSIWPCRSMAASP